ncbi:hypothetical protein [Parvicella tangerina]|uniref:Outer membrane protein beta-barrel domain-containing protein n=1 Tax=Parvicella tangerina TaxID=2829795 RepID=A0A916NAA2_9FLAO|nr:hypothetical protein [Parvicella tangerina]CAG5080394.1 hypothetical protein CRYO30217_01290 [Parvicella tangerina]
MKKLVLILILFSSINVYWSQGWVDIGVKGGWGPTFLFNQKVFDDSRYNHEFTARGTFGGKIGLNFNMNHEVTFDFMVGGMNQNFGYSMMLDSSASANSYTSSINYQSFDFLLMYRNNSEGKYFEVGPILSSVRSVERGDSFFLSGNDAGFGMDDINKLQYGVSLGFGAYFMGTDNFGITGGLRISYMMSDLINNANATGEGYPFGQHYVTYSSLSGSAAPTSSASHPLLIQLVFEANLDFAYLAKANCGRRKLLMF